MTSNNRIVVAMLASVGRIDRGFEPHRSQLHRNRHAELNFRRHLALCQMRSPADLLTPVRRASGPGLAAIRLQRYRFDFLHEAIGITLQERRNLFQERFRNRVRSHTVRENLPPTHAIPEEVSTLDRKQIVIRSYVGGLLKAFERKAA